MVELAAYYTEEYNETFYETFRPVYNDFKERAISDYKFELTPLSYESFIKSINDGLLQCIILSDCNMPVGFLVYTTVISESIELNIIHCNGTENINQKRKLLLEKFIELNKHAMKERVVTYPMLGIQSSFVKDIECYGFKTVNTSVLSYKLSDVHSINKSKTMQVSPLGQNYNITNWKDSYMQTAADVLLQSFSESSDALFDSRFKSYKGCCDILEKITGNIYGQFLPAITKVLLYKNQPVGFCFANLTNDKIANIPISAILKKYRGNGFSKILLKNLMLDFLKFIIIESRATQEINVSCDSSNIAAFRMYNSVGFREDYTYPLAYHSGLS